MRVSCQWGVFLNSANFLWRTYLIERVWRRCICKFNKRIDQHHPGKVILSECSDFQPGTQDSVMALAGAEIHHSIYNAFLLSFNAIHWLREFQLPILVHSMPSCMHLHFILQPLLVWNWSKNMFMQLPAVWLYSNLSVPKKKSKRQNMQKKYARNATFHKILCVQRWKCNLG